MYDLKIGTYSGDYSELSNSIIDKLNLSKIDWIKIDVERGEHRVLLGAKDSLKNIIFPERNDQINTSTINYFPKQWSSQNYYTYINS